MTEASFSWEVFRATPIVAILRGHSLATCSKIAGALQSAGFGTLEVTMNTPGVADIIGELNATFPDLNVGAGTVCTPAELETALKAGANFIVSPIIDERVIATCVERGVPVFPGAYTPTEIYRAWTLGATAVKVFPAGQLGPAYVRNLSGPLPQVRLLPTGGVTAANIRAFFAAGVAGVGMGSALLNKELIRKEDFAGLRAHCQSIKAQGGAYNHPPA